MFVLMKDSRIEDETKFRAEREGPRQDGAPANGVWRVGVSDGASFELEDAEEHRERERHESDRVAEASLGSLDVSWYLPQ